MVTKIISNKGSFDLFYDSEDQDLIASYKWSPKVDTKNGRVYAYAYIGNRKSIFLHRLIMGIERTKKIVDHKNGNGLDNRKCNLRIATCSQNQMNRLYSKRGKKGISFDKDRGTYRVRLTLAGRVIHGGMRYKTEKEAMLRYNEMAVKYYGEFASLNSV